MNDENTSMNEMDDLRAARDEAGVESKAASERWVESNRKYRDALRERGLLFRVESADSFGNTQIEEFETRAEADAWIENVESGEYGPSETVKSFTGPGI